MLFYKKLKWILGILLVFVLIIATNLIDRNNFVQVRDSVVTIYEDRLKANDIIYDILKLIHEKELALVRSDEMFFSRRNIEVNEKIKAKIAEFELTKLTDRESTIFFTMKENFEELKKVEDNFVKSGFENNDDLQKEIDTMKENLDGLTKIQLNEGGRQMALSKRALDTIELFTNIEIYLLVILAVVIQIIVMYKPKTSNKE